MTNLKVTASTNMAGQIVKPSASLAKRRKPKKRVSPQRTRLENFAMTLVVVAILFGIWEYAADRWIPALFISRPSLIGQTILKWLLDGTYVTHTWVTLEATVLGFAFGALGGMIAGYITGTWQRVGDVLQPIFTALYTLPRLALAPLFLLWFGLGLEFRVAFSAAIVFFLVYYNTFFGVREVNAELIAAVRIMGANRWQLARRVIIPSALTWVAAGLKISIPYALVGVVVAEMLAAKTGLGYLLSKSADQFAAHGTFAAIAGILVIAFAIDALVNLITHRALRWKRTGTLNR